MELAALGFVVLLLVTVGVIKRLAVSGARDSPMTMVLLDPSVITTDRTEPSESVGCGLL